MKNTFLPLLAFAVVCSAVPASERPNFLIVTVDDMNCDSVGVYGCPIDATPHMDQLAAAGLRFQHAHVQVGNCMPSRNVMWSGRYPHSNRVEGFYQVRSPDYPILVDLMKSAGYFTAIRGKATHSTPYNPYAWDLVLDVPQGGRNLKNVQSYFDSAQEAIAASGDKPFCVMVNISDPHKPFYSGRQDPHQPTKVFGTDDVPIPGFLFDAPDVRKELAAYYSSVRRADDCVGAVLKALDESGEAERTVVIFLSDHGMPLPFAKTQLYYHSTRTPLMVRWPGVTQAGTVDSKHVVSAVDLLPTLLDVAQIEKPAGLQGRSFAQVLKGRGQDDRDFAFTVYNENSGGVRQPMRAVNSKRFGYIFNPWSDGRREVKGATVGTATFRAMKRLAESDPAIARRLRTFVFREREEFFDYSSDPDALHNLINDPRYADEIARHRRAMEDFMAASEDHLLEVFRNRHHEDVVQAYMSKVEAESAARRSNRRQNKQKQKPRKRKLITLIAEDDFTVTVRHRVPAELGTQKVHVTLKTGSQPRRLDRKVISVKGSGSVQVRFEVPADKVVDGVVSYAAFVGPDYASNLQHVSTKPIRVR